MKSDRLSNISRRVLISSMALLPALSGMPFTAVAQAQATQDGALGSWNDGPAKQAILDFIKATTDRASPKFVPPEERIATFDQDGTLWVEHPIYSQVVYCLDRVPAVWRRIRNSRTSSHSRRFSRATAKQSPDCRCMTSKKFSPRH